MADVAVASIPAAPVATEGASDLETNATPGNHDNNPQPPPASEAAPNEAAPSPPKRPRTEEPGEDDGDHKRLKSNEEIVPMNLDLGAMLENALLSFEEPPPAKEPSPPVEPILKQETFEPPPAPPPRRRPPKPPPKKMIFIENPVYFVRAMNLQLLGNLAVQILLALFQQPREDSDRVLRVEQSEAGKVFKALKETFYQHLRLFSDSTKLIRADDLDISEPGDRETIEMVNLANFCVSCSFGPGGPTMAEMHEQFLKTFIPEGGAITEELARVYLSQKTQSYLAYAKVIDDTNEARAHLLNRFFPASLEGTLKHLHSEAQLRIPEADFVAPFKAMRTLLQTDGNVSEKRKALEEKYPFAGFLDELSSYMRANMTGTLEYADSHGINVPVIEEPDLGDDGEDRFDETEADSLAAALQAASNVFADANHKAQGVETIGTDHSALSDSLGLGKLLQESLQGQLAAQGEQGSVANGDNVFESKGLASLLFEKLGGGYEGDFSGNQAQASMAQAAHAQMYNSPYGTQFNPQQQYYAYQQPMQQQQGSGQETADGLPPTQSLPTSVLYERARQAAVAKSSAHARREGLHSTRRPWTPEEEKALMAGLDMVKGPHWSQILQLFGQNGTLSDILKDRTQVQLKDKARNLKLFFLKTNSEMPYYLQCVTGELKTRAPSQAARKEAEERARLNSEEEQARIAGIMTLAGGLQNNSPTTNGKSAPYSNGLANGGSVRSNPPVAGVPVANAGTAPPIQSMAPIQPAPSVPPVVKAEPPDTSILQPPPQHQSQPQPETQLQPQAQPQSQTQAHNEPPQPIQEVHQAESIGGPDTAMDANSTSTSMDLDLMQQLTAALSSTS